ncbi:GntR family transcriptional regulator [Azospira inquinata]|uniref:GntR family transcriptional regulator n=1 Tax=Azospira inquinata TaxID=2785627 RepID=A0A975SQE6_9RHOO|nr:GntR family transcriptional regulator [Azospira inquinata]QWT47330.1 GntR family transcriptional regulator [Azospira inquinata]QWT50045.1 GntR family transcriptional regulator [Azospira inquinata]
MNAIRIAQPALYEEVAERLRERIFAHELPPGTWIDEQALAEDYGISRTPLREALKVLAAEGLVTLKPRRGCYVTELSVDDIQEIFPIIAMLEGRCAYEATQKATATDHEKLEQFQKVLEQACLDNDIPAYFQANQDFHVELQSIAGNRWLLLVIQDLRKVLKLSRFQSLSVDGRLKKSMEEHRELMAAIKGKDPVHAEEVMRRHLLAGSEAMIKAASR